MAEETLGGVMANEVYLTTRDLMRRWQVGRGTVERSGVPRTKIAGLERAVRYHPLDVYLHEQRQQLVGRVTAGHLEALAQVVGLAEDAGSDEPEIHELHHILSQVVQGQDGG